MFKKPTKTQLLIRRVALSAVATISVLIIVTVSVLLMLGYRLDSGSGKLSQGALLQFDSTPNAADVRVDGVLMGSRTPTKQTVIAGAHTIEMSKDRYEPWQRSLTIDAGTLTWLDYTRFVPKERPVTRVTDYASLVGFKISEDTKWALAQEKADTPSFHLIDLRSEAVRSALVSIPEATYSDASTAGVMHNFAVTAWNKTGRYAIVVHTYSDKSDTHGDAQADKKEWIVFDTQDVNRSVNVTRLMSVGLTDLQFVGTNGNSLYGLTNDEVIRKLDLSAGTISRSLVSHVSSFSIFDSTVITYVGLDPSDTTQRVAGVYRDGEEKPHVLYSTEANGEALAITASRYFNDNYVAIAHGDEVSVRMGSYPSASPLANPSASTDDNSNLKDVITFATQSAVTRLSFSPGGDYVLAQAGSTFTSYEIEHKRLATGSVAVAEGAVPQPLRWLSPAQLWNDDTGTLMMRDFDGVYAHAIMAVQTGYDASLSQNGRYFYGVGKTNETYHVQRVTMILE